MRWRKEARDVRQTAANTVVTLLSKKIDLKFKKLESIKTMKQDSIVTKFTH